MKTWNKKEELQSKISYIHPVSKKKIYLSDILITTEEKFQRYLDKEFKEDELDKVFLSANDERFVPIHGGIAFENKETGEYYNTKVTAEYPSIVLPRHAAVIEQLRIGVIGIPGSGKTVLLNDFHHFLVSEFARGIPQLSIVSDMMQSSIQYIELQKQLQDMQDNILPSPTVANATCPCYSYYVNCEGRNLLLEFEDISGEDCCKGKMHGKGLQYDSYIMLIPADQLLARNSQIQDAFVNLLYETFHAKKTSKAMYITITKADLLRGEVADKGLIEILDKNTMELNEEDVLVQKTHLHGFDYEAVHLKQKLIMNLIDAKMPNLNNVIRQSFELGKNLSYFMLASLNYQPKDNILDNTIPPYCIDEVFTALFARLNFYPLLDAASGEEELQEDYYEEVMWEQPNVIGMAKKLLDFFFEKKGASNHE